MTDYKEKKEKRKKNDIKEKKEKRVMITLF